MTTFTTNPGVEAFETSGPKGLLRVEAGSPYTTTDSNEISVLATAGAHALTRSEAAPAALADRKHKGGDES